MTTTESDGKVARARGATSARVQPGARRLLACLLPLAVTVRAWWAALTGFTAGTGSGVAGLSPWTSPPPSLAELYEYVDSGDWVPGERAPVLEFLGRAFGFAVVIPVHALAYGLLWVLARPTRVFIAAVLGLALWAVI